MTYYARNLPHWHPPGKDIFISWRLFGSLPANFVRSLRPASARSTGKQFRAMDAELDTALLGPLWLKDPRVANCVVETIRSGEKEWDYYRLHAYVVMANHVHILIEPNVSPAKITQRLKGVTARTANKILGREGNRFWNEESFDHWVRNAAEFTRIKNYIEQNPVTAGLTKSPQDWPWSSATQ
jgi:REP-associated tyrosine transposase